MIVSFFVTALFWKAHLGLAKRITSYDEKLLWLNILLLFFVVLMPFSTAFYVNHTGNAAFFVYCVHVALLGLFNFLMIRYTIKKENLRDSISEFHLRWMQQRSLVVSIIFLLSIPISLFSPSFARISFVFIFLVHAIGDRYYRNKEKAAASTAE